MRVLALDTTTRTLSAAVIDGDTVCAERVEDPTRSHAERLPGALRAVLADAAVPLETIDVFAVTAGPGSFTGLRIGIATMQGLAFVGRKRIVPVSALDALAHAASAGEPAATVIGAWIDAHRRDVFSALYRIGDAPVFSPAHLVTIDEAAVAAPSATLERWQSLGAVPDVVVGSGATLYADLIVAASVPSRIIAAPALAPIVGLIAHARAQAGLTVDPAGVQPLYVRRPDAEIARDKEQPPSGVTRS
jgi:tRNA threonylcarbamoyladenosine biosynthesis protein TsaB